MAEPLVLLFSLLGGCLLKVSLVLALPNVSGCLLHWEAVPQAMVNAVLNLPTYLASGINLCIGIAELSLSPGSPCADVAKDGSVIGCLFGQSSVQNLVIKLLCVLRVCSLCMVLPMPCSLPNGIGKKPNVLPWGL